MWNAVFQLNSAVSEKLVAMREPGNLVDSVDEAATPLRNIPRADTSIEYTYESD